MAQEKRSTARVREKFNLERHLPYRLNRVSGLLSVGVARVFQNRFNLGIREWRIIASIGYFGPVSAADMIGKVAFDKGTVSRAISRLEQRGLVERTVDPADSRRQLVRLTDAGIEMHDRVVPFAAMRGRVIAGTLTDEERQSLFEILGKLDRQIDWLIKQEEADLKDLDGNDEASQDSKPDTN